MIFHKFGGRTVELFVPFDFLGDKVKQIDFGPIRFDHTIRWQAGQIQSLLALMAEVAGVDEALLRQVAYPDADRMMSAFIDMLPPEIRNNLNLASSTSALEQPAPAAQEQPPLDPDEPHHDETGLGMDLNG